MGGWFVVNPVNVSAWAIVFVSVAGTAYAPPAQDVAIPSEAVKQWADARNELKDSSWRFQIFRADGETLSRDFVIRRLGEYWLKEEDSLTHPGTKEIVVSGPRHKFVLSKVGSENWTAKSVVDANIADARVDSTKFEIDHYSLLPVAWLPGQDFAKLPSNSNDLKIVMDDNDRKGIVSISCTSKDALKEEMRYLFDTNRKWRLIEGERRPTQGNAASFIFGFKLEYEENVDFPKLIVETTKNIKMGLDAKGMTKISPVKPAEMEEFELPYYGLLAGERPRFWRTATFWLAMVGLLAIAAALIIKRRSASIA